MRIDVQNRDGVAILVALADGPIKAVRVNITLPETDLRQIDKYAEARGLTRSGFLLTAAREAMRAA